MKEYLRLDKYLADLSIGTRSEIKDIIRRGRVSIGGETAAKPETKIHIERDRVCFDGKELLYSRYEYYMLNKPKGVVSAVTDRHCTTVVDLITGSNKKDLFPVGRLDKDTEGLLLITNDGELSHELLSPKKHVGKVYYAHVEGVVTNQTAELFLRGVAIDEETITLPAELEIIEGAAVSKVSLTIYEGKFHQVKRMFEAVGMKVLYLKRLSMGSLQLDENLETGEYRRLTEQELISLKNK